MDLNLVYVPVLPCPACEFWDNCTNFFKSQAIPHLLSRYNFEFLDEEDNVICRTPAKDVSAPHTIPNNHHEITPPEE